VTRAGILAGCPFEVQRGSAASPTAFAKGLLRKLFELKF